MALTKVKGSILSNELYRRENNLSDVLDKALARSNLSVYSKAETLSSNDFVSFVFMFAGTEAEIPAGFQLCNGIGKTSRGTAIPNLTDKFVVGSGGLYVSGSSGGSSSKTTSESGLHTHSISIDNATLSLAQIPAHKHKQGSSHIKSWVRYSYESYNLLNGSSQSGGGQCTPFTETIGGGGSHNHSSSCNSTGNHTHTVNVIPPYYALALIIKL